MYVQKTLDWQDKASAVMIAMMINVYIFILKNM